MSSESLIDVIRSVSVNVVGTSSYFRVLVSDSSEPLIQRDFGPVIQRDFGPLSVSYFRVSVVPRAFGMLEIGGWPNVSDSRLF